MIYIGCDKAGRVLADEIYNELKDSNQDCEGIIECKDYPDAANDIAQKVMYTDDKAILVCGTGIGMSIAANRVSSIRASVCINEYMAEMARRHNDSNVLCLGARVIGKELAKSIVRVFFTTEFEGGRHKERLSMLD